ncbi:MAG: c-type cytochrome [Chitinophagales bacterium]|nr:c-type cytochrome [Chitinophagales bacterium]
MKKAIIRLLGFVILLIVVLNIFILATWDKQYEAPMPNLKATNDSAMIARGAYLVYGPAHCASCHAPFEKKDAVKNGEQIDLIGGWEMCIPPADVRAPNITPDKETGIGNMSDGQIARAMRYSVQHDGKILLPFMPFQELSDEDVIAILSYLRSRPAVKNVIPRTEYKFLGKALLAFGAITPVGPNKTPFKSILKDTTFEYGEYIANSVANCVGCHTKRDLKTGKYIGPPFAGGFYFAPDKYSQGFSFITPNITPDKETGIMAQWDQTTFINRFKAGRVHQGSHMPWETMGRIDEIELKALYQYLMHIKPVNNKIEKIVFEPGEVYAEK